MSNPICYICQDNLIYREYKGTKFLDDDGSKPCFQCLVEAGAFDEEEQAEA
jgi:hypothetical protein